MKRVALSLVALLLAFPLIAAPKKGGVIKAKERPIRGQYIVVFNDRVEDVDSAADEMVRMNRGRRNFTYRHALKGFSAQLSEQAAEALSRHPLVEWVEEDSEVSLGATQSGATWGIDRVDQRDLPLSSSYTYNYTGSGVKAYIIDTGIRLSHADFGGRAINGYDAIDGGTADDCNGHGTHVAGTVGGSTYGVAKGVTLVAVRVLDCNGSGSNSGVIAGVDWVTSNHLAGEKAVANMSLGGGANSSLDTAVRNSIADGVTYAIASGNSNADACNYSPARVGEAITVKSSTSSDARSSFSNWGTCTDIFAPGSSITSAWYTSDTATNTISGTSMATPHVAGVAALVLDQFGYLAPSDVWIRIRDNSTPNKITSAGTGSPNRLLYSIFGGSTTPAPTISSFSPTSGGVGTVVRINGSNFTGATSVTFNGQSASFTVISSSAIDATVPNCSSSGLVRVTTGGGTATSSGSFSVTGCGGTTTQKLLNPGFELGNNGNWTTTSAVIDNSSSPAARTGSWKAWMCGYGTTRTDYAYQNVSIASTVSAATLSFYLRITTAETTTSIAYDKLTVAILDASTGATITTLRTYSNLNAGSFGAYTFQSFSISPSLIAGKTIRVRFYATEDSSLQTSFLVDDTALNVTQ